MHDRQRVVGCGVVKADQQFKRIARWTSNAATLADCGHVCTHVGNCVGVVDSPYLWRAGFASKKLMFGAKHLNRADLKPWAFLGQMV